MDPIQFNSDCEGPVSLNDNAFELCSEFLPAGNKVFEQLSLFDDFLADIENLPGYESGYTLRLLLPFLWAAGVELSQITDFCSQTVRLVPDADKPFGVMASRDCPSYLISASYSPYALSVADKVGLNRFNVYATNLADLSMELSLTLKADINSIRDELAQMASIEIPIGALSLEDIRPESQATIEFLKRFFFTTLPLEMTRLLETVEVIGGRKKLAKLQEACRQTGIPSERQFYVGDSITDVHVMKSVAEGGGLSLSFNGNRFAFDAANIVCISPTAYATAILAEHFLEHGLQRTIDFAHIWTGSDPSARKKLLEAAEIAAPAIDYASISFVTTSDKEQAHLVESMKMRQLIRGTAGGLS